MGVVVLIVVVYEVIDVAVPVGALVGPAAVLGTALGFGAQRLVQRRTYSPGSSSSWRSILWVRRLELNSGVTGEHRGKLVEDIALRVTAALRGEVFTV